MKGSTKIILTNVETGEQEIHEDTNLITNALDKIININVAMNYALNSYVLPIATKALGGLLLFDGELTEEADNIHFPAEAHIVGYANQSANTTDKYRGSYNNIESGKTERGFISVWDFGTTQANGTIRAIARTSYHAGGNPTYYFNSPVSQQTFEGSPENDREWYPLRYDGEYVYMIKANSTTHTMRLAKLKLPMLKLGCADYSDVGRELEVIASWNTLLTDYTYHRNQSEYDSGTNPQTQYVYGDSVDFYEDGQDGFFYCIGFGATNSYNTYAYDLTYFTINYGDGSFEKSEVVRVRTGISLYCLNSGGFRWLNRYYGHPHRGIVYALASNRKSVCKIPLSNTASYSVFRVFADSNRDYIVELGRQISHEGIVYFETIHYDTAQQYGYNRRYGIMYPDGVYVLPEVYPGSYNNYHGNDHIYMEEFRSCDDDLTIFGKFSGNNGMCLYRLWAANYLGTINNLSSPITKTAAQTMKIVYTLTDVDEDEEG